jgi:uncharacterized membrane protein YqjE
VTVQVLHNRNRFRLVWDGLAVMLLLIGLVPLAGLVLLGRWPEWELGASVAMCLFALRQLAQRDQVVGSGDSASQ